MSDQGPLYILDGNSLVFRAFFALPTDLATASGTVTNAVHGFTSMLVNLLRDHDPSGIAVAFDRPEPTFRDAIVDDYKGNRPDTPELLGPQFDLVRSVLDALRIRRIEVVGWEADDVLATLATEARDAGRDVVVVTGDRDTYQLVEDPHVKVLYTRKGISDTVLYDEAGIVERTGVRPSSYTLLAAMRGDPSDNLPGVPGVGEKTAAKLVNTYGDLDGIFEHVAEQTPKLRENLTAYEERVRRNVEVMTLVRDVDLEIGIDDLGLGGWDAEEIQQLFGQLELKTMWQRLAPILGRSAESPLARPEGVPAAPDVDLAATVVVTPEGTAAAAESLGALGRQVAGRAAAVGMVGAWAGDPGRSTLAGLALAPGPSGGEEPGDREAVPTVLWLDGDQLAAGEVLAALAALVGPGGVPIVAHEAKELMRVLLPLGVDLTGLRLDTALAAYLLDPAAGRVPVEALVERYLGLTLEPGAPAVPEGQLALDVAAPSSGESLAGRIGRQAVAVGFLEASFGHALGVAGLERLHAEVELPLIRVLAKMEVVGIRVDADELRRIAEDLAGTCDRLEAEIQELAGEPFNVNSTPQLRSVLYDRLGLTPGKKTKTGYSTDAQTLEKLRDQHPIVETLLRYREVEKLRSTYGESLLAEVAPDGRIHASFAQTVARTGRLSSDHPNLHNIPVRTPEGLRLRRAFIPAAGWKLLVADYDQIELRVIAHLSGDPGLVAAFAGGEDVHRTTAAKVFGVAPEEVTTAQRNRAKMVSYGLAYGMEAYGLGQRLAIATQEAQGILDAYFTGFPAVRAYMEGAVAEARGRGYTETLFGRRRPLPDLNSPNRGLRMAAERQAMNAGIQGLAADLFKVALVALDRALTEGGVRARVVLQVHDEVVVEAPGDEEEAVGLLVPEVLGAVGGQVGLSVPLKVSSHWGSTWAEAKG